MNMLCLRRLLILSAIMGALPIASSERLPGKDKDKGAYITVDYLAWKAQEDQLQYVAVLPGGIPATLPFMLSPHIIEPSFNFDSGVRLQAGYFFCNDWDVWASWTRFRQCSCDYVKGDVDQGLIATAITGVFGNSTTTANVATSDFGLCFDTGSINVGRYFMPWDCISLETFMGIQWARINQKQLLHYEDLFLIDTILPSTSVDRYNNFSGVGPTIGAQFVWNLGSSDWSLFGLASGALLVGKFCTKIINGLTIPLVGLPMPMDLMGLDEVSITDPNIVVTIRQNKCRVRPTGDIQVGIGWEHEFCSQFGLQLRVAFEAQIWPNQWQASSSVVNVTNAVLPGGGDLTLYGATVGVGFLF